MANPEVTAALPRPESSQPPQHPEATPPAVETISGTTSEGSETLRVELAKQNSVSGFASHSNLHVSPTSHHHHSPRSVNSSSNAPPRLSAALESKVASGVVVPSGAHGSSSSAEQLVLTAGGIPIPASSVNVVAPTNLSITSSSIDGTLNSSAHHSSAPQKRFTAVNVNRKFLEKSSTASVPAAPVTTGAKHGNQTNSSQPPTPHSRLVTTKLTSLAQASHTSMVWRSATSSAPSSSGSTPAAQAAGPSPQLSQSAAASHGRTAPQASTPVSMKQSGNASKASSQPSKAWGARNLGNNAVMSNGGVVEFPTAAEAASSKKAKMEAAAAAASQNIIEAAAIKLQQAATADAFRGVHLDPKAHHWDDDGDDDDFLNEVIEFGDGRQYTIKHAEPGNKDSSESPSLSQPRADSEEQSQPPVSKEDRFGADISRYWPPARPITPSYRGPSPTHDPRVSDVGSGKALFNERSNRFENASSYRGHSNESSLGGGRHFPPASSPTWGRRDSYSESRGRWQQDRPSGAASGASVQTAPRTSSSTQDGDHSHSPTNRTSSIASIRAAGHPHQSDPSGVNGPGPHSRSRGASFTEHQQDRPFSRGGSRSDTAAPTRDRSRDSVRDMVSHLNRGMPPPPAIPQRRPSHGARDMAPPPAPSHKTGPPSTSSAATSPVSAYRTPFPLTSPRISHSSPAAPPHDSLTLKAPTMTDIQVFSKESMQSAAERARERRKLEEEQREREKERARQKAAELAAAVEARDTAKRAEAVTLASAEAAAAALITEEAERLAKAKAEDVVRKEEPTSLTAQTPSRDPDPASGPPMWRMRSSRGSKRGSVTTPVQSSTPKPPSTAPAKEPALGLVPSPVPALPSSHGRTSSWASVVKVDKIGDASKESTILSVGGSSWRTRAPSLHAQQPSIATSLLPTLHDVNAEEHDTLEIVDFSDMGKLVGEGETNASGVEPEIPTPTEARAEPSDLIHGLARSEEPQNVMAAEKPKDTSIPDPSSTRERAPSPPPSVSSRGVGMSSPTGSMTGLMSPQALANLPLPPSKQHFRESSMTALEDVMSRIKGALSDMRPGESAEALEEALAAASASRKATGDDSFAVTRPGRPESPPLHRRLHVRLRKTWPPKNREPVESRLLYLWRLPPRPVRLDILSWDPPIEGMSRKTLSRDELLFPLLDNPVVSLPRPLKPVATPEVPVPKVKLPRNSANLGRLTRYKGNDMLQPLVDEFNPVSCSPPPASPAHRASTSLPGSSRQSLKVRSAEITPTVSTPPTNAASVRPRTSSRLLVGADGVVFSPRLAASSDSSSSLVSFTVTSELEAKEKTPERDEDKQSVNQSREVASLTLSTEEATPSEESRRAPTSRTITPPPKVTPWAKSPLVYHAIDSPSSRNVAADPKNIKSLWEKNENAVVTTENSLEGITDEPPSFSVQDMKSDDGDEPKALKMPSPPPATTPTRRPAIRMSVDDAHRAFQQVPTAPSSVPETTTASSYAYMQPPEDTRGVPTAPAQQPQQQPQVLRPQYPLIPSSSNPVVYSQTPYMISPIGQPQQRSALTNGHHALPNGQAPSHMWMQVNPLPNTPMSPYYRPHPYGQPVIYPSPSTLPSPYSPGLTSATPLPMQVPKPMNGIGVSPGRVVPHQGSPMTPQLLSPVTAPSYLPGRATPSYYTPGPQSSQLPIVYPSSPAPLYSAAVSATPSGSPGPALYTSTPHNTYRSPPTW